jgi:hypothetical protein
MSASQSSVLQTARRVFGAVAGRLTARGGNAESAEARREQAQRRKVAAIAARRAAKTAERARAQQERRGQLQQRREERARRAAVAGSARARAEAEAASAFDHYLRMRERIRRMPAIDASARPWGIRERATIDALQPLWDATPDAIGSLRRLTAPLAVAPIPDGAPSAEERKLFFLDLGRLVKVGRPSLLVAEPTLLGGFGHASHGPDGVRLYNDDTLAFYEVLVALDCGAVLGELRATPGRRPVVWDMAGGWGGFAYQVKTLFPDLTYVITAPPELLLMSAVYLLTAFPSARCRFYDERPGDTFWRDLDSVDFAFATEDALDHTVPGAVHLALDIQALERMSPERLRWHVQSAYDLGARYIYSLGPAGPSDGVGPTPVVDDIRRRFWCYELPVPLYEGMPALGGLRRPGPPDGVPRLHRLGWRRIRP